MSKSFKQFINENKLDYSHQYHHDNKLLLIDGHLKDSEKTWLNRHDTEPVVSASVNLNHSMLNHTLSELKKQGISKVSGYIEHHNAASKSMILRAGFVEKDRNEHGSTYERFL